MSAFGLEARTGGDTDWALFRNGAVHLFWRHEVLEDTVKWLKEHDYRIVAIDAANWAEESDMHGGLAESLEFPNYYGRNLNALDECLRDVAFYDFGARRESAGTVLVLSHFDAFARSDRDMAHALLDSYAGAARTALLVGHRMLCLVQSDDPDISFDRVGGIFVMWNPKEWLRAKRKR